jgi:hypothetical protein
LSGKGSQKGGLEGPKRREDQKPEHVILLGPRVQTSAHRIQNVTAGGNAPFETGRRPPSMPGTDPVQPQDDSAIVPGGLDEIAEVQLSLCARCDMYRHPLRAYWLPSKLYIFIQACS